MANLKLEVILKREAFEFIESLPESVSDKIYDNMHRIERGERNAKLFSKLQGTDIWEFRTKFNGNIYRLFSFWDTDERTLIIATHGIVKKTQKTPLKEIAKAERIRKDYFNKKFK